MRVIFRILSLLLAICGVEAPAPSFTTTVTTPAGKLGAVGVVDGIGNAARMSNPYDMAFDQRTNNLWFAGSSGSRLRTVDLSSRRVTTVVGAAGGSANGPFTKAGVPVPYMTYMPKPTSCEMFISSPSHVLRRVDFSRSAVYPIAGGAVGYAEGTGSAAKFNYITSTAMLPGDSRTLHLCDRKNHVLRAVDLITMTTRLMAGTPQAAGYQEGTSSKFNEPWGLRIRPDDTTMWLSDFLNSAVRLYNPATKSTSLFAGRPGVRGNVDGALLAAQFYSPCPIRHHGDVVYVGQNHPAIRAIVNGYVHSVTSAVSGAADGSFATARFVNTHFMEIDCDGNLYSDDYGNDAIRKVVVTWPAAVKLGAVPFCTPAGRPLPPCWSATASETFSPMNTPSSTATQDPTPSSSLAKTATHSRTSTVSMTPGEITSTPSLPHSVSSSMEQSHTLTPTAQSSISKSQEATLTGRPTPTIFRKRRTLSRTNTRASHGTSTATAESISTSSMKLSTTSPTVAASSKTNSSTPDLPGRSSSASSRYASSGATGASSYAGASSSTAPRRGDSSAASHTTKTSSPSSDVVSASSSASSLRSGPKSGSLPPPLSSGTSGLSTSSGSNGTDTAAAADDENSPFASSAAGVALFVAIGLTLLLLLPALVIFLLWRRRRADRKARSELGEEAGQALVPTRGAKYTWKDEAKKVLGDIQATGAHNQRDAGDAAESVSSFDDLLHMHGRRNVPTSTHPTPTASKVSVVPKVAGGTLGLTTTGPSGDGPFSVIASSGARRQHGTLPPRPRPPITTNPFDEGKPQDEDDDDLDDVLELSSGRDRNDGAAQLLSDDFDDDDL